MAIRHSVNVPPQVFSWLLLIHTELDFREEAEIFEEVRQVLIDCSRDYGGTVTEDTDLHRVENVTLRLVHPHETLIDPTSVVEVYNGKD